MFVVLFYHTESGTVFKHCAKYFLLDFLNVSGKMFPKEAGFPKLKENCLLNR